MQRNVVSPSFHGLVILSEENKNSREINTWALQLLISAVVNAMKNVKKIFITSCGIHQGAGWSLTHQFAVVFNIEVQNGDQEAEDAFHVLCERLLDVPATLVWQRVEGDHVLCQPQEDQHHKLCLCLLITEKIP